MKKYKKYLTSGILAAAMVGSTFAIPVSHVKAYAANPTPSDVKVGDVVTVKNMPSVGKVDVAISLPKATTSAWKVATASTVSIKIYEPSGREVPADKITTSTSDYKFTPTKVGRYTVVYTATNENDVVTTTERYSILVSADTYTMSFAQNNQVVLPSYIDTLASRFDGNKVPNVALPNPDIYNEDGVLVYTNGAYNPAFDEADAEEQLGLTADQIAYYKKCSIKIVAKTDKHTYSSTDGTLVSTNGNYAFAPEEGTNVVTYTYYNTDSNLSLQTQTKTIIGSNTYDHTNIEIGYTIPNAPTTASLNERTYLPYASAYNKNDANSKLNVYTDVKVTLKGTTPADVTVEEDEDGLYFIPTVDGGDYQITYSVKDYYGNVGETYKYTIEDVKDNTAPTLYIVRGYDMADIATAAHDLHEAKYLVPSKVGRAKGTITFPAMYATDSVITDFSNFTFYRTISSTLLDSSINLQTDTYHTFTADPENPGKTSYTSAEKAAREVELDISDDDKFPAGDYTVTYRVSDGSGLSASWVTNFTISEDFTDSQVPVVTFADNFPSVATYDQVVSFAKPTVTDNSSSVVDVRYYLEFGAKTKIYEVTEDENNDKNLSFDMATKIAGQSNATIYDLAIENGGQFEVVAYATDPYNNTQTYRKTIYVNNINDGNAPEATGVAGTSVTTNTYEQYSTVKVDGVTFTDEDRSLMIVVTVRDNNGNVVTGINALGAITKSYADGKYTYTHPGVSFTANLAESYTVTYTAIDSGNNGTSVTTVLPKLVDKEAPRITGVVNNKTYTMELGTRYDLGIAEVIDNVDKNLTAEVTCVENPEYINGSLFVPLQVNENGYTIKYTAKDNDGNVAEEVTIYIKVVDTTKPILTVNNGQGYEADRKEFTTVTDSAEYGKIYIPDFSSEDVYHDFTIGAGSLNMGSTAKVVISGPDGKKYTVDNSVEKYKIGFDEDRQEYFFTPTTKGTYTVTYSASDFSNNAAEDQIINILVGETVKPTVSYGDSIATKIKLSDGKLIIDTSKIVIQDNIIPEEGEEFKYNTITLNEKNSGTSVKYEESGEDGQIRTYTFETEGTYVLTITAKDAAGNLGTYTTEIVVVGDNSTENYTNETTGVILIVVSLVILAGVIVFFAKGKGGKGKGKSSKKATKKVEAKEVKTEAKETVVEVKEEK